MECRDSDIFISIPCLLILRSLEDDSCGREICARFFPPILKPGEDSYKKFNELKLEYGKAKKDICGEQQVSAGMVPGKTIKTKSQINKKIPLFDFYNELERQVLGL